MFIVTRGYAGTSAQVLTRGYAQRPNPYGADIAAQMVQMEPGLAGIVLSGEQITHTPSGPFLLTDDGAHLLQDDGYKILL